MILQSTTHELCRSGQYSVWCGGDIRQETWALLKLFNSFRAGISMLVELHPDNRNLSWLGEIECCKPDSVKDGSSDLVLFTSGTTGTPKRIEKNGLRELIENKRGSGSPEDIWALAYPPFRWAGISLLFHCIKHRSSLSVPRDLSAQSVAEAVRGATHLGLTPTLFKKLLMTEAIDDQTCSRLRQITFGGEVATQSVLDQAKAAFPNASVSHVYASTELGDLCAASDGLEGFPVERFSRFSVQTSGELLVNGLPTGDHWKKVGDRYYFVGRTEEIVNVGGNKVSLSVVEREAMKIPGVRHAVAKAVTSPLMGNVVTLDFVGTISPRDVQIALRAVLPKYAVPAVAIPVPEILVNQTGKAIR